MIDGTSGRRLRQLLLPILAGVVAACSGGAAGEATTTSSAAVIIEAAPGDTTSGQMPTTTSTTTTMLPPPSPAVVAIVNGRGDDGSLEVGLWFASDPFELDDARLRVGTDADESYPGVGDPVPHIEAWVEITADSRVLFDGDEVVAEEAQIDPWVSWTGPGRSMFIYFIQNVPVRGGTVWAVLDDGGQSEIGWVAGIPFGQSCSYHDAGLGLDGVPGDVPQHERPCRYP